MSRTLRIISLARSDVDGIFTWIARRSASGAISWYLAFLNTVSRIGSLPETFAEAPESQTGFQQLSVNFEADLSFFGCFLRVAGRSWKT